MHKPGHLCLPPLPLLCPHCHTGLVICCLGQQLCWLIPWLGKPPSPGGEGWAAGWVGDHQCWQLAATESQPAVPSGRAGREPGQEVKGLHKPRCDCAASALLAALPVTPQILLSTPGPCAPRSAPLTRQGLSFCTRLSIQVFSVILQIV